MAADKRNANVVAILIGSLTLGAALLLWLEPRAPGWSPSTLLMAENGRPVSQVRLEFVPGIGAADAAAFDCIIYPDQPLLWQPRGEKVRLAVVGSDDGVLTDDQKEQLLRVLGNMSQGKGLDPRRVQLDAASDARLNPDVPEGARQLTEFLWLKGFVQ